MGASRREAAAVVAGTLMGLVAFTAALVIVTDRAGKRSEPVVVRPTEGPALGYSWSVDTAPPWWGIPLSLAVGATVGAGTAFLLRPED